jgi:5-methylcytosine-specific restriction endonuclease McrA
MSAVVVLNLDYTYLNTINWQKAVTYVVSNKAEIVREADKEITNVDRSVVVKLPLVIRLLKLVKGMFHKKVPFTYKNVYIRDEYTCQYCGRHDDLTIDHVLPRSRGGKSSFDNCVVACRICNNRKGNKLDISPKKRPYAPSIMEFLEKKLKRSGLHIVLEGLWK